MGEHSSESPGGHANPNGNGLGVFSWEGVRVALLCNGLAGQGSDAGEKARRLIDAVRAHGAVVPDLDAMPETIPEQMERARGSSPDVVAAVGGDGTVNAGARIAIETGAALLVVPSGTMNLVAKDLAIPLAFDRQMLELTRLRLCAIDYGSVTDKDGTEEIFLHSSAIGFVPRMARLREDLRASEGVGDWIGNAYRFVRGLFGVASKRVRFVGESGKTERATRSVLVSCNTIADMGPGTHLRTRLDGGVLGLYASAHKGPLATLRLAITFASGAFARDTETDCGTCTRVTISTRGARTAVSNDGELARLATPLRYEVRPAGLRVLAGPGAFPSRAGAGSFGGESGVGTG